MVDVASGNYCMWVQCAPMHQGDIYGGSRLLSVHFCCLQLQCVQENPQGGTYTSGGSSASSLPPAIDLELGFPEVPPTQPPAALAQTGQVPPIQPPATPAHPPEVPPTMQPPPELPPTMQPPPEPPLTQLHMPALMPVPPLPTVIADLSPVPPSEPTREPSSEPTEGQAQLSPSEPTREPSTSSTTASGSTSNAEGDASSRS